MTQRSFPPHSEWRITYGFAMNPVTNELEPRASITIDGQPLEDVPPTWTLTWTATTEVRMDS